MRGKIDAHKPLGDAARDRGDWDAAIQHYRSHLAKRPSQFGIWVQLGHALKEAWRLDEALEAYAAALRLKSDDADLLLSLGHVYKLMGERRRAIGHYQLSAAHGGRALAEAELRRLGSSPSVAAEGDHANQPGVLRQLSGLCDGLRPIASSGLTPDEDGAWLRCYSAQPWLLFEMDQRRPLVCGLALLSMEPGEPSGSASAGGWLYFDYGGGLEERLRLPMRASAGGAHAILAAPHLIKRLRWSSGTPSDRIAPPRVNIRALRRPDEVETLIRQYIPAGGDLPAIMRLLPDLLDHPCVSDYDAAETTLFLSELSVGDQYWRWRRLYEKPTVADYGTIRRLTDELAYKPTFSFIIPTFNTDPLVLRACLDSILAQTYADFEVCIADDHSTEPAVSAVLAEYAQRDRRVKYTVRAQRGHISAASNDALGLGAAEFVVLMDHDDLVPDFCLFLVACYINAHPDALLFFSDEDKIDQDGVLSSPYFKGGFNRFLMYGHNMINHLSVYRRSLVERAGGFRIGLEGSQDLDLFLRCYEQIAEDQIVHIPHVLYHWRTTAGSAASAPDQKSYAILAAGRALDAHFDRTKWPLRSAPGFTPGVTTVTPARPPGGSISFIISAGPDQRLLQDCIAAMLTALDDQTEVLIVETDGPGQTDLACFASTRPILIVPQPVGGAIGRGRHEATKLASGEIFCFLDSNIATLTADWLLRARTLFAIDELGALGPRVLRPDGSLKHFGFVFDQAAAERMSPAYDDIDADDSGYFCKALLLQEFSVLSGDCLFVRAKDYFQVGGFAPDLSCDEQAADLCLKLRAFGRRVVADPGILMVDKAALQGLAQRPPQDKLSVPPSHEHWGREHWVNDPLLSPNLLPGGDGSHLATVRRTAPPWRVT